MKPALTSHEFPVPDQSPYTTHPPDKILMLCHLKISYYPPVPQAINPYACKYFPNKTPIKNHNYIVE